jgi:hypothetical protein
VLRASILALLLIAGCGGSQGLAVASALVVAGTASAVSRATGGCYATCQSGTICNAETGFCDVLPCRGLCAEDEDCDESGPVPKCVDKKADIEIRTEKEDSAPPDVLPPE